MIDIEVKRLSHGEGLPLPSYASGGAAGLDVVAAEDLILAPGARHAVATGFALVAALSLALGIGTIDSDYRGEVKVILANLGTEPFEVRRGERIAQLVPAPVLRAGFVEVDDLDSTERGAGGFGSTGR